MVGERVGDKVVVAEMGHWDYDWSVFALFRDDAGRLFTATDSGCSCNSPYESPAYLDFSPVDSVQEAIKRASEYRKEEYSYYSEADYESFVKEATGVR